MKEFLATLALIAIIAGVGFYAAGWLTIDQRENHTTIDLKTGEIKQATDEAAETIVEKGREFVGKVKEEVREEVQEHSSTPAEPAPAAEPAKPLPPRTLTNETQPATPGEAEYIAEPAPAQP